MSRGQIVINTVKPMGSAESLHTYVLFVRVCERVCVCRGGRGSGGSGSVKGR